MFLKYVRHEQQNGGITTPRSYTYLDPRHLFFGEHIVSYHLGLDRDTGKTFKTEPNVTAVFVFSLGNAARKSTNGSHMVYIPSSPVFS